jgi:DNA-binding NtrC family response regulator/CHASE2 domain-containing sensor protein
MKRFWAFILGICCAVAAIVAFHPKVEIPHISYFLRKAELQLLDYRMKFARQPEISRAIKIILVNDATNLSKKLAEFTRLISSEENKAFKPKVIGFNYLFDASINEELITGASMANNIYYGYSFLPSQQESAPQATNRDILPFRLEITNIGDETSEVQEVYHVQLPSQKYLATARGIGFVNTLPDIDGVYRRIPLFLKYQDNWYGSLALLIAMEYMDIESVDITFYPGQYVEIVKKDGSFMKIPVNMYGEMLIDFTYDPDAGGVAPFETFSMEEDILARRHDLSHAPDSNPLLPFKDAIVLVGSGGEQPIPLHSFYPLIGIHANLINNIIQNRFIKELPFSLSMTMTLLFGMITGFILSGRRFISKLLIACFLISVYGLAAYGIFYQFRLLLPVVQPSLTIILTFCCVQVLIRRTKGPSAETPQKQQAKEKKRKVKTTPDDFTILEDKLLDIREELDRKSLRLRSKVEELRLLQERGETGHYDHTRQVASLQKEIRAREIEIRSLVAKEEELRRQVENLPFSDPSIAQIKHNTDRLAQLFAKYGFITANNGILQTFIRVEKLSKTPVSFVIQGEPGTGKKLLASIIRELSTRQNRPFLQVSCDGDMDMLEDDLFGHRQGAFPGATDPRLGLLRKVDEGTLVFEEIGNLSLEIQTRLIQTCRGKALRPLGDDYSYPIDVRMLATTSHSLKERVSAGKFREDLYHYFSLFPVYLPPLRDRKEDIPAIINHFIKKYNHLHSRIVERVSDEAMHLLIQHQWPGNITELEKVIERAIAEINPGEKELSERHITFEEADLSGGINDPGMLTYLIALMDSNKELPAYQPLREKVLAEIQRLYCIRLLQKHNGDIKNASIDAGLKVDTFKKMLTELMIDPENYQY